MTSPAPNHTDLARNLRHPRIDLLRGVAMIWMAAFHLSFDLDHADEAYQLVDGGNGAYTAAFLQSPTPGLTAVIRPRSKGVVDVVATDQTVAGSTYELLIEDTTQQSRQIVTVVVSGATPPKPDGAGGSKDTVQQRAAKQILAVGSVKLANGTIVKIVSASPTGNGIEVGYQKPDGATVTDADVQSAVIALPAISNLIGTDPKAVTAAPAAIHPNAKRIDKGGKSQDWGPVVRGLQSSEIRVVQTNLCMPKPDGAWSDDTQAALGSDRARRKTTVATASDGPLTLAEAKAFLGLSADDAKKRCSSRTP